MLFVVVVLFYVSWTTTVVSYIAERERERESETEGEGETESERVRVREVWVEVQYRVGGVYRTRCESLSSFVCYLLQLSFTILSF